jgi:para-nitrobenzyl esterase
MTDAVVTTTAGAVRGTSTDHGLVFRGIPYAAPPVGDRRFRPPARPEGWSDLRDCTAFGPVCPQTPMMAGPLLAALQEPEPTDEDCLFLNVWTPALDDARRPTMVWIHGGAFTMGSGSTPQYDGRTWIRDGVVLVTINYRLHALGFLYLDELFDGVEGTGNLGILDQVAALEWVRENISRFGGDPGNVTIFGESAGGMSVGTLLGTPSAAGLFHRAIAQSGASHHNLSPASARRVAERTLDLVGVPPGDWDALRAVPADKLVAASTQIAYLEVETLLVDEPQALRLAYAPVIDGTTRQQRADRLVAAGAARDIDLLVGTCADEYRLFIWGMPAAVQGLIPDPDVDAYLGPGGHTPEEARKVYEGRRAAATDRDIAAAVATDGIFTIPAIRLAEAQVLVGGSARMFQFSWPTPVLDGAVGACHAIDIPFVFDDLQHWEGFLGTSAPPHLAREMHGAWIRFATTGDPNGGTLPTWPLYDLDRRPVMVFDEQCATVNDPHADERRLWDGLW